MTPVFADTSFNLALLNPRDLHHARARELALRLRRPVVLTEFVLLEAGNALASAPKGRDLFLALCSRLNNNPNVSVVRATSELFEQGIDLYRLRRDKAWSLTDCISFVVMEEAGMSEALTADHHFEQAGFQLLLN